MYGLLPVDQSKTATHHLLSSVQYFPVITKQKKMLKSQQSSYLSCMLQRLDYTGNQLGNAHNQLVELVPCLWQTIKY
jgi:hypothetical protein